MEKVIYHFKPQGMVGNRLMPLNTLKSVVPSAYAEHIEKYKGREKLLEKKIPILNCLWNDVLHFSPIHPQIIINTWREHGWFEHTKPRIPIEVFCIPVTLLNPATTVFFKSQNYNFESYDPRLDKFWNFDPDQFYEQNQVEQEQLNVWNNDFNSGRRFLWYSHTTHILAQQEIDVSHCDIIQCK